MDYGWWSLVPPLLAISLAILTRRVVASLLCGAAIGALILKDWSANWNPLTALEALCEVHLWASLCDSQHIRVFVFTALMGAMIGVIQRSGGLRGVVGLLVPWARTRRTGQLLTWMLGLLIFIDDYANSLLLGSTMRPLADQLRISREKLAYLVDSTAAPVAGVALISTWVAGEIGYIQAGFDSLDLRAGAVDSFAVFVATIPYRFYVLFSLLFVPLVAPGRSRFWAHAYGGNPCALGGGRAVASAGWSDARAGRRGLPALARCGRAGRHDPGRYCGLVVAHRPSGRGRWGQCCRELAFGGPSLRRRQFLSGTGLRLFSRIADGDGFRPLHRRAVLG